MFYRGQCFGMVNILVWLIFEVSHGISLAGKVDVLTCPIIDIIKVLGPSRNVKFTQAIIQEGN